MARTPVPESLLDELALADGDFGDAPPPPTPDEAGRRLVHAFLPLALEAIVEDSPYQTRETPFDPRHIPEDRDLLRSVKAHGVVVPIAVQRLPGEIGEPPEYRIVHGHRRLAAARLASLDRLEAMVVPDPGGAAALTFAENAGRRDLTPYEKALALMSLKERESNLSRRGLSERTSIPAGTVASLVDVMENSPPALLRLFAGGLEPRAVQELRAVFAACPEEAHLELAALLEGATRRQAATCRRLVSEGADPLAAAKAAAAGSAGAGPQGPVASAESLPEEEGPGPAGRRGSRPTGKRGPPLPDPEDAAARLALAARTGLPKRRAKRLIRAAHEAGADYETLIVACAYAARGGRKRRLMDLASKATGDRGLASAVQSYLRALERARALIASQEDEDLRQFLQVLFLGAASGRG